MAKKKIKEPFSIPDKILEQVNECSSGGYLLFTFDEFGNPVINSRFDSPVHATSMQYYVSSWSKAIETLNHDMVCQNIFNSNYKRKRKGS